MPRTARAAAAGVDAVLVRTPSFFKAQMTADLFVRHYTEVADASPVPVLLYNVTMFTGVTMQVEAVERLALHPNIVGMKESGSDIGLHQRARRRVRPTTSPCSPDRRRRYFHALCAGCDGGILALAALLPDACVRMQALVREQRLAEARALQHWMTPLARSVGSTYGVAGLKAALDLVGYSGGVPRPPLRRRRRR